MSEESIKDIARKCIDQFERCANRLEHKNKTYMQAKHADMRLWVDSIGAAAQDKASLDWRLRSRPDDLRFIAQLLHLLSSLLLKCGAETTTEADAQNIITNIDATVDSLALIAFHIRRGGRKSRLAKTDELFSQNRHRYRDLRAHLACLIQAKPTRTGRPTEENSNHHNFEYFVNLKLSPIQERLVEANLRRRHRFMEAQRRSHALQDPNAHQPASSSESLTRKSKYQKLRDDSGADPPVQHPQVHQTEAEKKGPRLAATHVTTASGIDSEWQGLRHTPKKESNLTRITSITSASKYPRFKIPPDMDQTLAKCPCCCQGIPTTEMKGDQRKKHIAIDVCPYTCIIEDCPTPYNLFVTEKEWSNHVQNDHQPRWQCPYCAEDHPLFSSISEIRFHLMSTHLEHIDDDLEQFIRDSEIHVMGITQCPLCDSVGPQDSPIIVGHVMQHVHEFSLRSLPWPVSRSPDQRRIVGSFNSSYATDRDKNNEGNGCYTNIAKWAEDVAPRFDQSRQAIIFTDPNDPDCEEVALSNTASHQTATLQLCSADTTFPFNASELESGLLNQGGKDYFLQNDYFAEDSSNGHCLSQASDSTPQTQSSTRRKRLARRKNWTCSLCKATSTEDADAFFQHLDTVHPADVRAAEGLTQIDVITWKSAMLDDALWFGMDAQSETGSDVEDSLSQSQPEFHEDSGILEREHDIENLQDDVKQFKDPTEAPQEHLEKEHIRTRSSRVDQSPSSDALPDISSADELSQERKGEGVSSIAWPNPNLASLLMAFPNNDSVTAIVGSEGEGSLYSIPKDLRTKGRFMQYCFIRDCPQPSSFEKDLRTCLARYPNPEHAKSVMEMISPDDRLILYAWQADSKSDALVLDIGTGRYKKQWTTDFTLEMISCIVQMNQAPNMERSSAVVTHFCGEASAASQWTQEGILSDFLSQLHRARRSHITANHDCGASSDRGDAIFHCQAKRPDELWPLLVHSVTKAGIAAFYVLLDNAHVIIDRGDPIEIQNFSQNMQQFLFESQQYGIPVKLMMTARSAHTASFLPSARHIRLYQSPKERFKN